MERRNDYRICQWDVWDPLPQIAPLLPAERPEQAPPREVAAKTDADNSDSKPDAAGLDALEAGQAERGQAEQPTKKRRHSRRF
jgi:hypothetical protein